MCSSDLSSVKNVIGVLIGIALNQHCENEYTTQSNLQIQCNPYQISNGIFHRTRTKNLKICMETQKTLNSQSSLEGKKTELEESDSLTSDYTTKLQ